VYPFPILSSASDCLPVVYPRVYPPYSSGTRVVLFNLKNPPEFDFEVDPADIRMMRSLGDDDDDDDGEPRTSSKPRKSGRRPIFQQHRPGQNMTLDVPEDYSLRSYMEVLYLRPKVDFTLRGWALLPEEKGGGDRATQRDRANRDYRCCRGNQTQPK